MRQALIKVANHSVQWLEMTAFVAKRALDGLAELCGCKFVVAKSLTGVSIMAVIINKDGGGGGGAGFTLVGIIVGAVLLAVAVVGFLMWDNYKSGGAPKAIVVTGQAK